jgi:mono/diheme cytochrome c family protein
MFKPTLKFMPTCALAVALLGAAPGAMAQGGSRGELLYATHCITCHTEQMHWRAKSLATDWTTLKAQVQRWQGNASLGWSDDDVVEVARYLNARFYRFAPTGVPLSLLPRPSAAAAGLVAPLPAAPARIAG